MNTCTSGVSPLKQTSDYTTIKERIAESSLRIQQYKIEALHIDLQQLFNNRADFLTDGPNRQ